MQCAFYLRAGAWRSCDLSEVIVLGSGGARHLVLGVKLRPLHQLSHVSDEMLSDPADSVPLLPFPCVQGWLISRTLILRSVAHVFLGRWLKWDLVSSSVNEGNNSALLIKPFWVLKEVTPYPASLLQWTAINFSNYDVIVTLARLKPPWDQSVKFTLVWCLWNSLQSCCLFI